MNSERAQSSLHVEREKYIKVERGIKCATSSSSSCRILEIKRNGADEGDGENELWVPAP